jgi:methylmalonyl-CoA/ethylmalonyl-CoA epimerase
MVDTKVKPTAIAQVSWAVKDIDKVVESWSKLYGFGPWTYRENGGLDGKGRPWKIRMAFTQVGPLEIELVQCTEGRIVQSRFLDTWGEGVHHIGWHVDDVDAAVASLTAQGARLIVHDPGQFAYLDAGGPGGAIFELMQKKASR